MDENTIDPQVKNLVSAIGRAETGEPTPEAYSKTGASGEFGRYQFMPNTYRGYAKKYLGDENAQPTIDNQNKIAYSFVKEKKDQGYNPAQIASMWNAGEGKPNAYKENYRGINSQGVKFDTPAYAQTVSSYYQQLNSQNTSNTSNVLKNQLGSSIGDIQQQKQQLESQGEPVSVREDRAKPTLAGSVLRGIAKVPVQFGLSLAQGIRGLLNPDKIDTPLTSQTDYLGKVQDIKTKTQQKGEEMGRQIRSGETTPLKGVASTLATAAELPVDLATTVLPSGGIASGIAEATGKQGLKKVGQSLARGGAIGSGLDVRQQLADTGKVKVGQALLSGLAGAGLDVAGTQIAPRIAGAVSGKAKGLLNSESKLDNLIKNRTQELSKLEKYSSIKKITEDARAKGLNDPKEMLAKTDVLNGSVDKNGTITTLGEGGAHERYSSEYVKPIEDVIQKNLKQEGSKVSIIELKKRLYKAIDESGLEGGALERAYSNADADLKGYMRRADKDGFIPTETIHKAKVDKYSNINYMNPESKRADKAIAKALKETVEDHTKFIKVKELNNELASHFKVLKLLEKLDNKKVEGGKLGKYFAQLTGAAVGSHFGPVGSIVGSEVAGGIKGAQMARTFKGIGKNLEYSPAMKEAVVKGEPTVIQLPQENSLGNRNTTQNATTKKTNKSIGLLSDKKIGQSSKLSTVKKK